MIKYFIKILVLKDLFLKNSKKRFAYLTKQEALNNFIKRKEIQIKILEINLDDAKQALKSAKNLIIH